MCLQGVSGRTPPLQQLQAALSNHTLYVYCGHGSGEQYVPLPALRALPASTSARLATTAYPSYAANVSSTLSSTGCNKPACKGPFHVAGSSSGGMSAGSSSAGMCASGLLMGCSSGRLRLQGAFDPTGVVVGLLMAGKQRGAIDAIFTMHDMLGCI